MQDIINQILEHKQWFDAALIPLALIIARKGQKIKAAAFVVACMIALRLQAEIIIGTGHPFGFTSLMKSYVLYRGMCIYAFFVLVFLGLSYISPRTTGVIYLAASLSIFFMAFVSSFLMMLL